MNETQILNCWMRIFVQLKKYSFSRWLRKRSVSKTDLKKANLTTITKAGEFVRIKRVKRFTHCAELDPLLMDISVKGDENREYFEEGNTIKVINIK